MLSFVSPRRTGLPGLFRVAKRGRADCAVAALSSLRRPHRENERAGSLQEAARCPLSRRLTRRSQIHRLTRRGWPLVGLSPCGLLSRRLAALAAEAAGSSSGSFSRPRAVVGHQCCVQQAALFQDLAADLLHQGRVLAQVLLGLLRAVAQADVAVVEVAEPPFFSISLSSSARLIRSPSRLMPPSCIRSNIGLPERRRHLVLDHLRPSPRVPIVSSPSLIVRDLADVQPHRAVELAAPGRPTSSPGCRT